MVGSKLKIVRGENKGGKKTRERLQQATNDAKIYNSQNKNTSNKRRSQTAGDNDRGSKHFCLIPVLCVSLNLPDLSGNRPQIHKSNWTVCQKKKTKTVVIAKSSSKCTGSSSSTVNINPQ